MERFKTSVSGMDISRAIFAGKGSWHVSLKLEGDPRPTVFALLLPGEEWITLACILHHPKFPFSTSRLKAIQDL